MRGRLVGLFIGCLLLVPLAGTQIYQKYKPSADWEQSSEGLTVHMKEYGMDRVIGFEEYAGEYRCHRPAARTGYP